MAAHIGQLVLGLFHDLSAVADQADLRAAHRAQHLHRSADIGAMVLGLVVEHRRFTEFVCGSHELRQCNSGQASFGPDLDAERPTR